MGKREDLNPTDVSLCTDVDEVLNLLDIGKIRVSEKKETHGKLINGSRKQYCYLLEQKTTQYFQVEPQTQEKDNILGLTK